MHDTQDTRAVEMAIQEGQAWLETFQTEKRGELLRLNSDLAHHETRRSELTERVSQDNSDRTSQADLTETDETITEIKEQIATLRETVRQTVMERRRQISGLLNDHISAVQEAIFSRRDEKEKIRTEDLPRLERQRSELMERSSQLENEILHLTEEIAKLNRISVQSEDIEFE